MINSNGNVDWGNDIAFAKNLTVRVSGVGHRVRSTRWLARAYPWVVSTSRRSNMDSQAI
jgi:hypothetical protein